MGVPFQPCWCLEEMLGWVPQWWGKKVKTPCHSCYKQLPSWLNPKRSTSNQIQKSMPRKNHLIESWDHFKVDLRFSPTQYERHLQVTLFCPLHRTVQILQGWALAEWPGISGMGSNAQKSVEGKIIIWTLNFHVLEGHLKYDVTSLRKLMPSFSIQPIAFGGTGTACASYGSPWLGPNTIQYPKGTSSFRRQAGKSSPRTQVVWAY